MAKNKSTNFLGMPGDFSRIGSLGELNMSWAKIPTYYYDVQQHHFPLTENAFSTSFDGTIKVFNEEAATPGHQTNAATGSGVNEAFLAYGVGVVAIGEGLAFTQTGALVPNTEGETPCFDGCPTDRTTTPATLWWGGAVWDFIENFFQAYRLVVVINNRWLIVDESLFDVGMSPTPPEFVGASSSTVPAMPFIQETNEQPAMLAASKAFIPQNSASGSTCVPPPTAGVTYGHPRIIGLANRLYCFNQPIPYLPGMRFDLSFIPVENDAYFMDAMRRDSVIDLTKSQPYSGFTENLDCPSSVINVPGGKVSIGLVLKGAALHPRVIPEYIDSLPQGSPWLKAIENNMFLAGIAQQMLASNIPLKGNLAGLVDPRKQLGE